MRGSLPRAGRTFSKGPKTPKRPEEENPMLRKSTPHFRKNYCGPWTHGLRSNQTGRCARRAVSRLSVSYYCCPNGIGRRP
jgi:hypothetical protein